ncbi:hypothetical protein AM588_10011257 [Phytophthora nicotianae]|uniref:Uncharacterized protein n=1 Tax=Phytophthora nicotianae TaxID=4792 RepID=A0A0W8DAT2_PHYNI|nr:hypothetical protein AM588_10011257 [Phytophthora nicotianae]
MSLFSAMADDGSVWAQGSSLFNISSPLNDLLEKDDFTLEQVLQEDELVQEVKTRNTKLLDFLSQEAIVQKLIEYVVRTPEDTSDDLRTLKYPYMSCEVICCDITSITETLVTASEGKIVETLFEFLYQTQPLDPRLAGYFEKIVTMLMYCATDEMPPAVASAVERLPQICAILKADAADAGMIRNQRHQEVPRLGLRRLKMVGLVVLLMQSKYQKVDIALLEQHAIETCLDLFFKFESVNMLHADVESMVIGILESGSHELLVGLVKDARLLPRIIEAHEKNDEATAVAKGFSLGYVGHLHRICNMLMTMLEDVRGSTNEEGSLNDMRHADTVLELFEEDDVTWKKWEELSSKVLAPIYERERLPLGGVTISQGGEDPYSVMGFNQNDELLNAQFAEMLGASGFGSDPNGFDTDFDVKDTDTPMLPEIMNDSSSSEEEDEEELARQESAAKDNEGEAGADRWANFESGGSWAKFENTFEDIPFEPIPGMENDDFDDDEPVPDIVTTADLAVNRAAPPLLLK